MMNYFEWFGIERGFNLDQGKLRKLFLAKSMDLHPDKSALSEDEAIRLSEFNNKAYATLKDGTKRLEYILHLEKIVLPDEKYQLPPEFLMEMLDLNMGIEAAKEEQDEDQLAKFKNELVQKKSYEANAIKDAINQYDTHKIDHNGYEKLKNFYFISKYLLRIEESINTFASH